ncbi:BlaI/MecI/CopY family transcriptional regulator [Streptomyces sp. I05A-00742]|uniref:BlaI/MecI/CopY family transcriptional regulator n=1 Tax=Streptomyces sp. I05A-00742 TaxID=2732853 RepID=UPI001488F958|nr:BlaI/MecI/CopY family transcriptional regulator [Streptomyces sp. I05A-00742]
MGAGTPATAVRRGRRSASGALECEVLAALQRADGPLTPREVQDELPGAFTYCTVVTILRRLHGKRVLTRTRQGLSYAYAAVR